MRSSCFVSRQHSTRCLVDWWEFHCTTIHCFEILCFVIALHHFRDSEMNHPLHGMAGAMGSFFFSSVFFENFWIFSVIWVKFCFSFAHSCFSRLWMALPIFVHSSGHIKIRSGSRLNVCQSLPDQTYPLGSFFFKRVNFVNSLQESDKCLLDRTFQLSPIFFSCSTSRSMWVDLATSIHFSGIVNVSPKSTLSWTRSSLCLFEDEYLMHPTFPNLPNMQSTFALMWPLDYLWNPLTRLEDLPMDRPHPSCHPSGIPDPISWWLVRHFARILNLKMSLMQAQFPETKCIQSQQFLWWRSRRRTASRIDGLPWNDKKYEIVCLAKNIFCDMLGLGSGIKNCPNFPGG